MTKQEAIRVILSDSPSWKTSLNWAVNYCREAQGMSGEEFNVQCRYILHNITRWRHPQAKEVREALRGK